MADPDFLTRTPERLSFSAAGALAALRPLEGTSVRCAALRQFGGTRATTERGTAAAWQMNVPARPYVAVQTHDLPRSYGQIICDRLAGHVEVGVPAQ